MVVPALFEVSSSGTSASLVSWMPTLVVPRGVAERLLSRIPQPMPEVFVRPINLPHLDVLRRSTESKVQWAKGMKAKNRLTSSHTQTSGLRRER